MSKYRIKGVPYISSGCGVQYWYSVEKKILGFYWIMVHDSYSESAAKEYIENVKELKKCKVKFIDVVEEE